MTWLVLFLLAKKANVPTLGPRFLVRFPSMGKAIEVKCPTYARGPPPPAPLGLNTDRSIIDKLRWVQNCAAQLVTRTWSSEHITPVLWRLHCIWLPVRQQITYKILPVLLTYKADKALNGIADLFHPYTLTRQLRSSKNLLVAPKSNLKFYGDRSFQVAAPGSGTS